MCPRRGPRDGPPSVERAAGRRRRREGEPWHRPPAVEPATPPDGQGHRRGRRHPWLRHALGLRARLPSVERVAGAAHPPDGRGGRHLPSRRLTLSRHRRAPVSRGVPPPGPLRRHHHPSRRPQLRVVRQGLALRRRSLYDRLRAIAEYDYTRRPDTVLVLTPSVWEERLTTRFCEERNIRDCYIAVESRDALERRDLRLWRRPLVRVRQPAPHARVRQLSRQPRRKTPHGVAQPEARLHTPPGADGPRLRRPSASPRLRSGRSAS